MRPPRNIRVGGITYRVRVAKEWPNEYETGGMCDPQRHEIRISGEWAAREVLVHELVHAVAYSQGLEPSEEVVDRWTTALLSLIVGNPSLVAWLQGGGK